MTTPLAPFPWSIPVPLRRSRFVALHAQHADYNVETALGAIAPFALAGAADGDGALVGWADLQAGGLLRRRLGAGRACTFRGQYVKGVGRTQLAGNWHDPGDAYHASGHLLPSGAVREYVVSRHLLRHGLADAIVPCQGVLLAPLAAPLRDFHRHAFADLLARGATPLPIDTALQALSIKPAGFARFSNLSWLLDECVSARALAPFFAALARVLDLADDEAAPDTLAHGLAAAIARAPTHFAAFVRAGVFWGSFHNNFTIDGRFVDLELPSILGAPFFGHHVELLADGRRSPPLPIVPGCELLLFLEEARQFLVHARQALTGYLEIDRRADGTAREFAAEFLGALADALQAEHPARDEATARRATEALLDDIFGARARRLIRLLVAGCQERALGRRADPFVLDDDWIELPLRPAPRETVLGQAFYWPRALELPPLDDGERVAAQLRALDAATELDVVLALLRAV